VFTVRKTSITEELHHPHQVDLLVVSPFEIDQPRQLTLSR
jgi:hypothetical protein